MRNTSILLLFIIGSVLLYFTVVSADKAFRSDWKLPQTSKQQSEQLRLVLITQDLDTPFWDKVGRGAHAQAEKNGASLEVWGSYGNDQEDFLKKLEIAIHSKVDGIIVQGLDTDEFKNLTKIKAAFYGIPIIMVANDVPMAESLRKTYVGSDQYLAGKMVAAQLLSDMGDSGNVVIMSGSSEEYYQRQRLQGIQDILKSYPEIQIVSRETTDTRDQVISATQELLNQMPEADAFIAVNAKIAGAMIHEISRRSQVDPYYIYSFDDGPESLSLLKQGKLDGIIEQSPENMGKMSVDLMMKWLSGDTVPLNMNGYFTDIRMLKAMDVR